VLRLGLAAADEPDDARQEGQRLLAVEVEEPLGGEDALEVLDAREELADAHGAQLVRLQLERAALGPERRLGVHDDVGALLERCRHRIEHLRVDGDGQRHVGVGVAQGEEGHARAGTTVELDDLPLDPQGRHPVDVVGDLRGEQPDRPGVLSRRVARAGGQRGTRGARRGSRGRGRR
jgi:hypothetical protein